MTSNLEVGEVLMCTVDRIVGTTVFVKIPLEGKEGEGSIALSEIAPGRIRNLRDYVTPKKKIVCKIIRISGGHIELSLRRVTQKEVKEVKEKLNLEKSYTSILKSVLGEKSEEVIKKITEKEDIYNFLQEAKTNPKELEEIVGKKNSDKIIEILRAQKTKSYTVKKEFILKSEKSNGLRLIKEILEKARGAEIKYISGGKYTIKKDGADAKVVDNDIRKILEEIESNSKKEGAEFSIREK
jgi:translation initiation factor 2 alpha subunit (eIF-2alpha)